MTTRRILASALLIGTLFPFAASAAWTVTTPPQQTTVFVPFLRRYITVTKDWRVMSQNGNAMILHRNALSNGYQITKELVVSLFPWTECDSQKLAARVQNAWTQVGAVPPKNAVQVVRISGMQGAAFSWLEPGARFWCVVPQGRTLTAKVEANDNDVDTIQLVNKTILGDLIKDERSTRMR